MWHGDGSVKVVKVNVKPFVVTSNVADTLLYTKYMGLVTFFGHDNGGHRISYTMTQRLDKGNDHSSGPIFTFVDDFSHCYDSDQ